MVMDEGFRSALVSDAEVGSSNNSFESISSGEEREALVLRGREFLAAGSASSATFSMTSATFGAGVLALPYAIRESGFFCGLLLICFIAVLSYTSTFYIVKSINSSPVKNYDELAFRAGGRAFCSLAQVSIFLFCFGVSTGYLVAVGDIIMMVLRNTSLFSFSYLSLTELRLLGLSLVTFVVLLPLCMSNRFETLRYTSFISVLVMVSITLIVVTIFVHTLIGGATISSDCYKFYPESYQQFLRTLNVLVFAFSCQANVPGLYNELHDQCGHKMLRIARRSTVVCILTYTMMGFCGYFIFKSHTSSNILFNLAEKESPAWFFLVLTAMAVAIGFAYPLNMLPCRLSMEILLSSTTTPTLSVRKRALIVTLLVGISLICASYAPSIALVFGFVGATSGSFVSFVLPAVIYLKLSSKSIYMQIGAILITIFGLAVAILGVYEIDLELK